jgi:hypothetical protein
VVIAESFTNAFGWERSVSESSPANATTDPSNVPHTKQAITKFVFMIHGPPLEEREHDAARWPWCAVR